MVEACQRPVAPQQRTGKRRLCYRWPASARNGTNWVTSDEWICVVSSNKRMWTMKTSTEMQEKRRETDIAPLNDKKTQVRDCSMSLRRSSSERAEAKVNLTDQDWNVRIRVFKLQQLNVLFRLSGMMINGGTKDKSHPTANHVPLGDETASTRLTNIIALLALAQGHTRASQTTMTFPTLCLLIFDSGDSGEDNGGHTSLLKKCPI
ncbi:uncharacterized protein EI90DRAFT_3290584 [Cantharellus anzutake]|uniref:uncharacterized protein n=1 Tax=Cantharellus anzutake TaxID=1750568 RepID=UPI00190737C6|nr:uncharacterized protein EI90DRAFT_3290584 [Cantharellus anzutake]KAF8328412.1 hypothetical protein EI90DRAFT_3290584 [Cantharellus anzutake]